MSAGGIKDLEKQIMLQHIMNNDTRMRPSGESAEITPITVRLWNQNISNDDDMNSLLPSPHMD